MDLETLSSKGLFDNNHILYELENRNTVISDFDGNILLDNICSISSIIDNILMVVSKEKNEYLYNFYNNKYEKINVINEDKVKITKYINNSNSERLYLVTDNGIYELKVQ